MSASVKMTFKFEIDEVVDLIGGNINNLIITGRREDTRWGITYNLVVRLNPTEHLTFDLIDEKYLVKKNV